MVGIIKDTVKGCKKAIEMIMEPKEIHGDLLDHIIKNEEISDPSKEKKILGFCKVIYNQTYQKLKDEEIPSFTRNVIYYTRVYNHIRKQI